MFSICLEKSNGEVMFSPAEHVILVPYDDSEKIITVGDSLKYIGSKIK